MILTIEQTSLEDAIIQKIKEGNGDIHGMKELAERFDPEPGRLTYVIKKLYVNKKIKGVKYYVND